MPLNESPVLTPVSGKTRRDKVSITFSYNFVGDILSNQFANGVYLGSGSRYIFNVAGTQNNANVSKIESLMVSLIQSAENTGTGVVGNLYIYVPSTGQMVLLNNQSQPIAGANTGQTISAMIPIVANQPSVIHFIKIQDQVTGAASGQIIVSAMNFKNQPFVIKS